MEMVRIILLGIGKMIQNYSEMMKLRFIVLLFIFPFVAFAQQKKVTAVYVTGEDEGIKKILGTKLVAAIARSDEYTAIERTSAFLAELNREQNYQRTGAVNDDEISRLGKYFGAQYVCVADVTDIYGEKYISARLINVETAEIIDAYDGGGNISSMNDCIRIADEIASKLSPIAISCTPTQDVFPRTPMFSNDEVKFGNCNITEIYAVYIQKRYGGRDISDDESARKYMHEQVQNVISDITKVYGLVGIFDDSTILYKGRDAKDITEIVMSKLNLQ